MNEDFSKEFLGEMGEKLEMQRAELIDESAILRSEMREREHDLGDSIDESVEEQGTSTELRLKNRERNLLIKISEALERIELGEFGYCTSCGDPISEGRLRARPMAELCIACKEAQEREERRMEMGNPGMFSPMK